MNFEARLRLAVFILFVSVLVSGAALLAAPAWITAGVLVLNILCVYAVWSTQRAWGRATAAVHRRVDQLCDNDFGARVAPAELSSFHALGLDINRGFDHWAGLLKSLIVQTREITAPVRGLESRVAALSTHSQKQTERAQSVAAAMEQLAASVASIAESAQQVRAQADNSLEAAERGNVSMSELIGEITRVEKAVQNNAAAVREFVHSASAITAMTQQVKTIADQTNLLALNAAIEAARAGEQGRGFAVVADEVRNLAVKSAQSTSEIDRVTQALGQGSSAVEQSINEGVNSLKAIEEFFEKLAEVLIEAQTSVKGATGGVAQITQAASEQSHAHEELARSLEAISQTVREHEADMNELLAETRAIEQRAQKLNAVLDRLSGV